MSTNLETKTPKLNPDRTLFYFLVFGFIGWIFETIAIIFDCGQFMARGIFFIHYRPNGFPIIWGLPFILMYGIGGLLIVYVLKRWRDRPLVLFLLGMTFMTIFELLTSYFCEFALGTHYWQYHNTPLTFDGRIGLIPSISWGVLSVLVIRFVEPALSRLYNRLESKRFFSQVVYTLIAYVAICLIIRRSTFY